MYFRDLDELGKVIRDYFVTSPKAQIVKSLTPSWDHVGNKSSQFQTESPKMVLPPRCILHSFAIFLCFGLAATAHASNNTIVLYASKAPVRAGNWAVKADSTAAGGFSIENPNLGAAKIAAALAKPQNYFELKFPAYAGQPYHLWIRSKSLNNAVSNDSVLCSFPTASRT